MDESPILSGRGCGACTLCCKLLGIEEVDSPQGQWCRHCDIGRGCKIYDQRPTPCRDFHCGYLIWPMTGEHWFPARSKMVIVSELEGKRVAIYVDPARPDAWRERPCHDDIRQWARSAAQQDHQVVVFIGRRAIVIFPDREVELGAIADDERIITFRRRGPAGDRLEAVKMKADDPRIAGKMGFSP